jgi:hypothetical protein
MATHIDFGSHYSIRSPYQLQRSYEKALLPECTPALLTDWLGLGHGLGSGLFEWTLCMQSSCLAAGLAAGFKTWNVLQH